MINVHNFDDPNIILELEAQLVNSICQTYARLEQQKDNGTKVEGKEWKPCEELGNAR